MEMGTVKVNLRLVPTIEEAATESIPEYSDMYLSV